MSALWMIARSPACLPACLFVHLPTYQVGGGKWQKEGDKCRRLKKTMHYFLRACREREREKGFVSYRSWRLGDPVGRMEGNADRVLGHEWDSIRRLAKNGPIPATLPRGSTAPPSHRQETCAAQRTRNHPRLFFFFSDIPCLGKGKGRGDGVPAPLPSPPPLSFLSSSLTPRLECPVPFPSSRLFTPYPRSSLAPCRRAVVRVVHLSARHLPEGRRTFPGPTFPCAVLPPRSCEKTDAVGVTSSVARNRFRDPRHTCKLARPGIQAAAVGSSRWTEGVSAADADDASESAVAFVPATDSTAVVGTLSIWTWRKAGGRSSVGAATAESIRIRGTGHPTARRCTATVVMAEAAVAAAVAGMGCIAGMSTRAVGAKAMPVESTRGPSLPDTCRSGTPVPPRFLHRDIAKVDPAAMAPAEAWANTKDPLLPAAWGVRRSRGRKGAAARFRNRAPRSLEGGGRAVVGYAVAVGSGRDGSPRPTRPG